MNDPEPPVAPGEGIFHWRRGSASPEGPGA